MQNKNSQIVAKQEPHANEEKVGSNVLSDQALYEKCRFYGAKARFWRQKFLGLLPEVYKRRLFEKKGFNSIYEFSAKLAGVSEEQVGKVLNLERRFQDKPDLHKALVEGEVSVNKLIRVASIATAENQTILLQQIKNLPQKAVETLVRDERMQLRAHELDQQSSTCKFVALPPEEFEPQLSGEVKQKLYELQEKGIDINAFILSALEKRECEIETKKQELAKAQCVEEKASRYIPMKIKKILREEHGEKCSIPTCQKPAEIIHHSQRFSLSRNHDPRFLAPLCEEHHAIAHSVDYKYHVAQKAYQ